MTETKPGLLPRIQALDASHHAFCYVGFLVAEECVGQVHTNLLADLLSCHGPQGTIFKQKTSEFGEVALELDPDKYGTEELRTGAMQTAAEVLVKCGHIKKLHEESYAISAGWGKPTLCTINRNAAAYFGISSPGVHLVCYFIEHESIKFWLAQRSATKSTYPLLFDPIAAGGQPAGLSLQENLEKEAEEEAGICKEHARQARPAGVLSQMTANHDGTGLKHSLYFVWDMEVDASFQPTALDGEVEKFELWTLEELEHDLRFGTKIRPSQRLVFTDFLIRHGYMHPDGEPDYLELICAMHQPRLSLYPKRPAYIESPVMND